MRSADSGPPTGGCGAASRRERRVQQREVFADERLRIRLVDPLRHVEAEQAFGSARRS